MDITRRLLLKLTPLLFFWRASPVIAAALADRAVIDTIMNDLSSSKGGFKDLIRAVVLSESFAKN